MVRMLMKTVLHIYKRVYKNGQVYQHLPFGEIDLLKWDIFYDREHLIDCVVDYSIQHGADLVREKVDNKRYRAVCANVDCNWRIHASVLLDGVSWAIKTIEGPHSCERLEHNPMAGKRWCASKILEDVRANFQIPMKSLQDLLCERYGVTVPESTVYKARALAVQEIQGSHDESYAQLPYYIYAIKDVDPQAYAFISWINQGLEQPLTFRRMFVSFEAQYKGFIKGCRPLIGIDGCHLKGNFNGCLLSAIALDGNQQIFPVAYAIVSEESIDNWTYFFRCLRNTLASSNKDDWVFMSDRMRGVEGCIQSEFPRASRRICCRHLYKNFKTKFPGPYFEAYFWQAADAYNEWVFNQAMTKMKKLDPAAYQYLMDIDLALWSRWKFDPSISCSDNTNNFTESWNATLGLDRIRPIMGLIEGIRRSCMVRIGSRQANCESWIPGDVTPFAKEQVRKNSEDARFCKLYMSGKGKYEVVEGKTSFPINLVEMWCKGGRWQISGIPCKHALRVINNCRLNPYLYVSEFYSVEKYKQTYELSIQPMPDQSQWPQREVPHITPPEVKRTVGRPKRNRRREPGEQPKGKRPVTLRCSKCGTLGHNKNGCGGGLTAAEEKSQGKGKKSKKGGREERVGTQEDAYVLGVNKKRGRKAKKSKAK